MHVNRAQLTRIGATLAALLAALLGAWAPSGSSAWAAPPTATSCVRSGTTLTCSLWARAGSLALSGTTSVPIWGFSDTAAGPASLPGPTIDASQGDTLEIVLTNNLAEPLALGLPGLSLPADTTGIAPGGVRTYTVALDTPGTYLYEAGLTPGGARQTAMGLFGALVVRPAGAPAEAYGPASAFDTEEVLVVSEVDPAFNANPAGFDMRSYRPRYLLINGLAFPNTQPISVAAGDRVLLRYLNASPSEQSLGLLGLHQTVIAQDGAALDYPYRVVSETLPAGATLDTLTIVPATAAPGTRYALYGTGLPIANPQGARVMGGMLTFLTVAPGAPGADLVGPAASAVSLSPTSTNGAVAVNISASISDVSTGGSSVIAAEYFIDTLGVSGSGTALSGGFGSPTTSVTGQITAGSLATLASGNHTVYVRGQDSAGNWGAIASAVFTLDQTGPTSSAITLSPSATNSAAVTIGATGSDAATGNANVTSAEYFIDIAGAAGSGTALTLNQVAPVTALSGTISAATIGGLSEGAHTILIRSRDSFGNWGAIASAALTIDRSGPATSAVSATPNPNNGTLSAVTNQAALRVSATVTDALVAGVRSNITTAEGSIDTPGANAFLLNASDGAFNSTSESVTALVPLTTLQALGNGAHTIYVRGRDAAGNWGAASGTLLVIDRTAPALSGAAVSPNPTSGAPTATLTATATDPANGAAAASPIAAAEYFLDGADPGVGRAIPMSAVDGALNSASEGVQATINAAALANGSHTITLRARDAAGNWSAASTVTLVVQPDIIFADGFESGNTTAWSSSGGTAARSVTAAAAMVGTRGLQVTVAGNTPGYVQNNTPVNEVSYRARFYFNPNGTTTGNGVATTILSGHSSNTGGTTVFQVQYRRTNAGAYQVRAGAQRAGGITWTTWYAITNGASNAIEIAWQSGASAAFSLYTNGALQQTLTGLNTGAYRVEMVRMGPSSGLAAGMAGVEYFDAFVSTRTQYIGP